jgi:hypothetical protein
MRNNKKNKGIATSPSLNQLDAEDARVGSAEPDTRKQ